MATLAFGLAGAAIGGASGLAPFLGVSAAGWGWSLGLLAGGSLQKNKLPGAMGPRLQDLRVMTSTYGNAIPRAFGRIRVAGNMIWSTPKVEHATTATVRTGGKGGGGTEQVQTSFYYTASFAVAICEGPIIGIRKVWANGRLIYSVADDASGGTVLGSTNAMTVYLGSESQVASALQEATEGAGNVPAYRGTAYVEFTDLLLTDFNNSIPNLEFEVVVNGSIVYQPVTVAAGASGNTFAFSTDVSAPCAGQTGEVWVLNTVSAVDYVALYNFYTDSIVKQIPLTDFDGTVAIVPGGVDSENNCWIRTTSGRIYKVSRNGIVGYVVPAIDCGAYGMVIDADGNVWATNSGATGVVYKLSNLNFSANTCTQEACTGSTFSRFLRDGAAIAGRIYGQKSTTVIGYVDTDTLAITELASPGTFQWGTQICGHDGYLYVTLNTSVVKKLDQDGAVLDTVAVTGIGGSDVNGVLDHAGYLWITGSGGFSKINTGTMDIEAVADLSIYDGLVGEIIPGVPLVFDISVLGSIGIIEDKSRIAVDTADLGNEVVKPLCLLAGLEVGDLDVSALVGVDVDGYLITERGPVRGMIEPLMGAYFFDAVESDNQIKFVRRGGSSAATIAEADLAARADQIGETPDQLPIERRQELELPVAVDVAYLNRANNYQVGKQGSRRLITSAKQSITLNLALVLSDDHARQIAETLMYSAWLERQSAEFSTSRKYAKYEPTDILTVLKGSDSYAIRVTQKDEGANGCINWKGVIEDATVYTQTIAGAPSVDPVDEIVLPGPTQLELLDIPLLREIDDQPGFYMAAAGLTEAWAGVQLYQSKDAGVVYTGLFNALLLNASTMGVAQSVLGSFPVARNEQFDEYNSVDVLMTEGELESATRAQVLNGANAAMLGGEILQFRTATLIAPDTYRLTGLLRGRLGSESFMAAHVLGESFVLLDADTLGSVTELWSDINQEYLYKPVTINQTLAQTTPQAFTDTGRRVKPLAPWHLGGGRNAGGDLLLRWIRRSRYESAWRDQVDVALGEASEAYVVDILSAGSVVRTIETADPEATYTAAQIAADFGSPTPASIDVAVYQLSEQYGRGYAATGSF